MDQTGSTAEGTVLVGRYRLGESLGRGGMGKVWRAHDEVLHRTVAVKELTAALYVSEADRAVLLARTQKEARAAARINHSAVVTVHDVFEYDERPWIVMELVDGGSLADTLQERERVEPAEAARIAGWVVRALRAAHTAGVLHRDVKPANVLLARDGRVLLTDFGIAAIEGDSTITRTGEIVGSLDYLAPERVRGADPGPASDLWAVGVLLFAAVEGFSPFRRQSPLETMQAVVLDDPGPAEHAGPLAPVISALLSKAPEHRPTADRLEQMLAQVAEGRRPPEAQEYVATRRWEQPEGAGSGFGTGSTGSGAESTAHRPAVAAGAAVGAAATAGTSAAPQTSATPTATPTATPAATPTAASSGVPPAPPTGTSIGVPTPQPQPQQPAKRRWRTAVAVVVAAGLVGVGAAFGVLKYADRGDERAAGTSQGQGQDQGQGGDDGDGKTTGAVPKDWVRITDDVGGFSLLLPPDFKRQTFGDQIDYTPDNGRHLLRIGVNKRPTHENSYLHAVDLEQTSVRRLPAYERVRLASNTFRGNPGALWEFTWVESKGVGKGPRRAIDQLYTAEDGTEYAIYMSGPVEDWDRTRDQFENVLRGWRPEG